MHLKQEFIEESEINFIMKAGAFLEFFFRPFNFLDYLDLF